MIIQEEFFGPAALDNLSTILSQLNPKKVLVVTGGSSYISSGARSKVMPMLKRFETIIFDDFEVNPKIQDVYKGVALVKGSKPDLIIAIGGGSVLDMAKILNIISSQKIYSVLDLIINPHLISSKNFSPLVAIPTTFGTGSEATNFAVVYINKNKYSVEHYYMKPDFVIIDPELSYNLPKKISASTAFDALCQGIESFWSINSTDESQDFSQKSIELILKFIKPAVLDSNKFAIGQLTIAANLSGKAINITKTTAPHAISYPITSYFNIPHGHAVALTLGKFFIINSEALDEDIIDSRGAQHLNKVMVKLFGMFECDTAQSCHNKWYSLLKLLNLETDFKKIGIINSADIDCIIKNINLHRMKNHPVRIDNVMLSELFNLSII